MTKGPILQGIWNSLSDERKQRIQARANDLETQLLSSIKPEAHNDDQLSD